VGRSSPRLSPPAAARPDGCPAYQFLVRLYVDKRFLKHTLREWGVLAPVIFMGVLRQNLIPLG
jgi:hypothetical protein